MAREERYQYKESSQAAVLCLALLACVSECACFMVCYATVDDGDGDGSVVVSVRQS